jgi:hypothetical protein
MGGVFCINHGSVLVFLTLALLVLTCLQASGSILTRNFTLVNQSSGYSIFFLRAFSEIAGVSLSATIAATLESIKWAMICRNGRSRARFVDFLALQQDTTILGLLSLATGAAVPSVKTRLWSITRLLTMVLVPGIGILIMSMLSLLLLLGPILGNKKKGRGGGGGASPFNSFDNSDTGSHMLIIEQVRSKFNWRSPPYPLERHILGIITSR